MSSEDQDVQNISVDPYTLISNSQPYLGRGSMLKSLKGRKGEAMAKKNRAANEQAFRTNASNAEAYVNRSMSSV